MLRPIDLLVVLKLLVVGDPTPGYADLARDLGIGVASAHTSVRRARAARLLDDREPRLGALERFLTNGVRYAFYVVRGPERRGVPTGFAAPMLAGLALGRVAVWPDPSGGATGHALAPLHPSAPSAALRDPRLYELLALVDALRDGDARQARLATELLRRRLGGRGDA